MFSLDMYIPGLGAFMNGRLGIGRVSSVLK